MDTSKPTKTSADYLVIAVSPVLIMVMVHSVCFFLVDVFYRGEAAGGVRWVLFWFVLAVVLIARIGIEQGDGHAMVYGLLLAGATWVYLSTVQPNVIFGALLLAIVWFTAHKITCNCTLIDDDADASGQGLMQSLRRLPRWFKKGGTGDPPDRTEKNLRPPGTPLTAKPLRVPLGRAPIPAPKKPKVPSSQVPGIWLIYYSLAALPIFGLGQTLLPAGDLAARHRGFVYLFCYLAAALGLLMATSFLGLRRYLRQRYLVMPGNIAFGWIQFGVAGAVIVLFLATLLPRPGAGQAWGVLRYHVDYQIHRASEYAARFNPHGKGAGRPGDQAPPSAQPDNLQPQPGPTPNPNAPESPTGNGQGDQPPGANSNHGTSAGKDGGEKTGKPLPDLSPVAGALYPWLKAIFYLAAVIGFGWLFYRYRVLILSALSSVWALLRGLFRSSAAATAAATSTSKVLPFKMFKSPFLTGADRVWPPEEVIIYTYNALQSWALEKETPTSPQTPSEFCRQLAAELPEVADALEHLAFVYGHAAYGASIPATYQPEHLRSLWHTMALPRPKRPPVETVINEPAFNS